jgi:integrase
LKFSALVFCRPGEIRHAEWTEVDFEKEEWRIPPEKMKMKRPHIVPLARQSLGVLEELKEYTDTTDIRTRRVDTELVQKYVIERLRSVFPFVLDNPLMLYNETNRAPLFMLCFACSNDAPASHKVAGRIAGHLCRKHEKN